jgi:hypothetical protein
MRRRSKQRQRSRQREGEDEGGVGGGGGGGGGADDELSTAKDQRRATMMSSTTNGAGHAQSLQQQQQRRMSHDLASTRNAPRASMDGASTAGTEVTNGVRADDAARRRGEDKRGEKRLTYAPLIAWAIVLASASVMREIATRAAALTSSRWARGEDASALKRPDAFATDWFDDIFVSYGPILPLLAMGSRAVMRVQSRDIGEELAKEVRVYVVLAAFRVGAYATLRAAFPRAFISDHVFLGASVFTAAHGEFLSSAVDFLTLVGPRRGNPLLRTGVMLVGAYALALMCATASLCFVTARWFHDPIDTAFAMLFGWFTLQLPMTSAIVRPRAHELATALAL